MSLPKYPEYVDAGPYWLHSVPAHWRVVPNKAVLCPRNDVVGSNSGDFLLLSLTLSGVIPRDIDSGKGKFPAEFDTYKIVSPNDLIFCLFDLDETPRTVGLASHHGMITGAYDVFECAKTADPRFLNYFYLHIDAFKGLRPFYTGLRKVVRPPTFMSVKFALPPTVEQNAICSFLDRETAKIDALVQEQQHLIDLLKEKRQAVISHAVTKGLNPDAPMKDSGVEWLGKIPAHWKLKRLKHISPFIAVGIVVNPSAFVADDGLPFIYGGDIREGVIDWENSRRIDAKSSQENSKTTLRAGDLLTVRVGAPGITAVVPSECEGGNCASVMLIRQGSFNSSWLCYAMNTRIIRFQVEIVQYGAAQEQFNISHAVNFWAPLPLRAEQDAIAEFLVRETAKLDDLISEATRAIDLLQERRTALISAAVTGKIDVRGLATKDAA